MICCEHPVVRVAEAGQRRRSAGWIQPIVISPLAAAAVLVEAAPRGRTRR